MPPQWTDSATVIDPVWVRTQSYWLNFDVEMTNIIFSSPILKGLYLY